MDFAALQSPPSHDTQHGMLQSDRSWLSIVTHAPPIFQANQPNDSAVDLTTDEGYEDDDVASLVSLPTEARTPAIMDCRTFYKNYGDYHLPHDEQQFKDWEYWQIIRFYLQGGKLHHTELPPHTQEVLDIGTGTGSWAIEFADKYSKVHVRGIDIAPIQPELVPPNLEFELDDASSSWVYETPVDFINIGNLGWQSERRWRYIYGQAKEVANPKGAAIEHFEVSMQVKAYRFEKDDPCIQWNKYMSSAAKKMNRVEMGERNATPSIFMENAGFTDVQTRNYRIPLNIDYDFHGAAIVPLRQEGLEDAEIKALVSRMEKRVRRGYRRPRSYRLYVQATCSWAVIPPH